MKQDEIFSYSYSAKENAEVLEIRRKYLPQSENKLEELWRLDNTVRNSGMIESLSIGVIGFLLWRLGVCLTVQIFGSGDWLTALGILLGIVGILGMIMAYPIYRKIFSKTKARFTPRILELTAATAESSGV